MNFQVTVLKILVSYPDGFAPISDLKRDMAILVTSGRDWSERTKRLASRVPKLDIFSERLIERIDGGWRITSKGRAVLEIMEARPIAAGKMRKTELGTSEQPYPSDQLPKPVGPTDASTKLGRSLREQATPNLSPGSVLVLANAAAIGPKSLA
ncbi:hypothetical protein [Bradyrhizobium sp. CCBAU 11445]|uniref:hypothetical protein n=1 Tax=Bradyrhizobium sp. CCBAU 11445 TaxID=1630896 RepID=UPI0023054F21|nr:hypothetical protein [Bradyrhizobium sp. CCBAU 11445]